MTHDIEWITLNGARLGYSVHATGPGKPPLVFAHGYAMRATGDLYRALLETLAQRFAVHALDLPGHGASAGAVEGWSYETVADTVVAFARALALEAPVFVGHSFGAVIGLLAELRHPGAFPALCLLSPGPADSRRDPVDTLDALIEHGHDREALRHGFRGMFVREPGDLLDMTLDAATLVHADVHRAQKSQNPRFSIDSRLGDVTAPVLLVCGASDGVVLPERQHDMAGKLPRSKEVLFSGEGHMLANEHPGVTAREILAFLDADTKWMTAAPAGKEPTA